MNDPSIRLSWSDFVFELSELTKTIANAPLLFLVGGAVRDALLGRSTDDIDVAVAGDAIAVARFVTDALDADIYIMDRERDVARVFVKRGTRVVTIDFAKFRGATLDDDLRARDFTLNAMAADLPGNPIALIDPLEGAADLGKKVLRRCSPLSIANDPIRALRAVRLSVQFDLKIHPDTGTDIRRHACALSEISRERVRDEFFTLLRLERAARGLRVLAHMGLLRQILPVDADKLEVTLSVVERMAAILSAISSRRTDDTAAAFDLGMLIMQLDRYRAKLQAHLAQAYGNGREHTELLVLAATIHALDSGDEDRGFASARQAAIVAKALVLTQDERRRLSLIVGNYKLIVECNAWSLADQHRFWNRLGDCGIDAILLAAAFMMGVERSGLRQSEWLQFVDRATLLLDAFFNRYDEVVDPRPLLDGRDVQRLLNIGPGPPVGQMLAQLREAQAEGLVKSVSEAREFILRSTN